MEILLRASLTVVMLVPYSEAFVAAAEHSGVPVEILVAQAWAESKFDPLAANERSGCRGIAQFSEETWSQFGTDDFDDAFDPQLSIEAQAEYMDWLYNLLDQDWERALGAYVWGIGRLRGIVAEGGTWEDVPRSVEAYAENALTICEQGDP